MINFHDQWPSYVIEKTTIYFICSYGKRFKEFKWEKKWDFEHDRYMWYLGGDYPIIKFERGDIIFYLGKFNKDHLYYSHNHNATVLGSDPNEKKSVMFLPIKTPNVINNFKIVKKS